PTTMTSNDYPNLLAEGETVDTIAVPAVLAAYNWSSDTERSRRLALFVDAFFTKFPTLQNPPFHPKWKEISLTAPLAGWNRAAPLTVRSAKWGASPLAPQVLSPERTPDRSRCDCTAHKDHGYCPKSDTHRFSPAILARRELISAADELSS